MINGLISKYSVLNVCKEEILSAKDLIISTYENGGKLLICGNGGSCADGCHIVGELMKGFLKKRPLSKEMKNQILKNTKGVDEEILNQLQGALPAISLSEITGLNTAFCNDVNPDLVFAQSVVGLGKPNDILLAISTSGNSKNVVMAAQIAKGLGLKVIALTSENGGKLNGIADICIKVPETETYLVQELHLPVYHYLCAAVEEHFFYE